MILSEVKLSALEAKLFGIIIFSVVGVFAGFEVGTGLLSGRGLKNLALASA